ncbi:DUF397 domain-containing protein [Streptomyces sp. NPDC020965]|uniref:DUF397 domain-containing protein n=1 Tax=Streptomyces sp. NPDC020965 TaxID=3365105 RepID=UPI003796493B
MPVVEHRSTSTRRRQGGGITARWRNSRGIPEPSRDGNTRNPGPAKATWSKPSRSDGTGNSSIEFADLVTRVGIHDSKDSQGPALVVPAVTWAECVGFATGA